MEEKNKQLLITDLCARAQYKVKICVQKVIRTKINGKIKEKNLVDTVYGVIFYNDEPRIVTPQNFSFLDKNGINNFGGWTVEVVKPYLRPMSSMTDGEDIRRCAFLDDIEGGIEDAIPNYIDWLNAHHFDYRDLIKRGLAIEAPEGMYNF